MYLFFLDMQLWIPKFASLFVELFTIIRCCCAVLGGRSLAQPHAPIPAAQAHTAAKAAAASSVQRITGNQPVCAMCKTKLMLCMTCDVSSRMSTDLIVAISLKQLVSELG